jgi:5-methylcytosine-specific restriction protein A
VTLKTLRPRIQTLGNRLPTFTTQHLRKRGRAGVNDRNRIRQRDRGLCQACLDKNLISIGVEVDHTIPLHKGGADTDENKRLLCLDCHEAKSKAELQP